MSKENPYIDDNKKYELEFAYQKFVYMLNDFDHDTEFQRSIYLDCRVSEMVQDEILRFLLLTFYVDGDISPEEYDLAEELTGADRIYKGQYDAMRNLFPESARMRDYIEYPPMSIKYLVKIGKAAYRYGLLDSESMLCESYADYLCAFLKIVILQDQRVDEHELIVYQKFTALVKKEILSYFPNAKFKDLYDIDLINSDVQATCVEESKAVKGDNCQEQYVSYDSLMQELDSLVGLNDVKEDVHSVINLIEIMKARQARGMKKIPMSLHLVFSGNPGTGKTTVARLLSKIYKEIGVLSKGHLVEVDRAGLVGGYVGQTAQKVKEVVKSAIGGILFIDEAYSLTVNKTESDYGYEAVDSLLKEMEDHRDDLVVIVAGYPDPMESFLKSNPGLKSRFNKTFIFEDYEPADLCNIFKNLCKVNGYNTNRQIDNYISGYFYNLYKNRNEEFANGREVRNFFENAVSAQANRLASMRRYADKDLSNFELSDFDFSYNSEPITDDYCCEEVKSVLEPENERISKSKLYEQMLLQQSAIAVEFSGLDQLAENLAMTDDEKIVAEMDALNTATKKMLLEYSFSKNRTRFENLLDLCSFVPDEVINAYDYISKENLKTDSNEKNNQKTFKSDSKNYEKEYQNDYSQPTVEKNEEIVFETWEGLKNKITGVYKVTKTHLIFISYEYNSEVKFDLLKLKDVKAFYPNKIQFRYDNSCSYITHDCQENDKLAAYIKLGQKKLLK